MPNMRTYNRSFAGGEISPEMYGRIDDAKFQSGAALMRNFIATPTGAAKNRPGFAYVATSKSNGIPRIIPFTYSLNQTMVIELGAGYARFYTQGEMLQYSASQEAYIPSAVVTVSVANPTVVTWANHGMKTGDAVGFFFSANPVPPIVPPTGLSDFTQYTAVVLDANTFNVKDASGNLVAVTYAGVCTVHGIRWYNAGDLVSYGGATYVRLDPSLDGQDYVPGTYAPAWYLLPSDLAYEIPTPYAAADLFGIHYAQSADVMTLVHPNYPPATLSRLGATAWVLANINFGPPLATPQDVAVAATPGYLAQIASISTANPALITTETNHTLAMGDGVYAANLTAMIGGVATVMDGFYMVSSVPVDSSGNLIEDELYLMNYSGAAFSSTGWSSYGPTNPGLPITIQYGTQIFNITSPYAVQALASDGVSTSALSSSASVLNNLDVPGSFNTITWAAVANAQSYNVYKQLNGLWGYIGNTTALTFVDDNIAPDMSITPGTPDAVFSGAGNYPGAVCYFQQRKWFAGTTNGPNNAWGSNSGTESMFSYSLPTLATDRLAFQVAALKADVIQHLVPMLQLIMLTSETEFAVVPVNSQAITPSSISVNPQSYIGASSVQPTIINTTMVYAAARGGHVRELGYAWTVNGYMTGDLSLRAAHLFDNLTIVDQAYAKSPIPIVWFVSSSGQLLGLTYIPEEQLGAWHEHTTDGIFQSIACVAEGSEDFLYAVISRTINGQSVNYIERMASRLIDSLEDSFFVDAGSTFDADAEVTDGTTVTLSPQRIFHPPGANIWGTVEIDASNPIFAYPAQTDVGSLIIVTDSSGKNYRLRILTTTSTTEASAALVLDTLPAEFTPAEPPYPPIGTWSWARTSISGLTWLEGCTVAVLADGGVQTQKVVTDGAITLDYPATIVQVGLPYTCDLETLPLVLQLDGFGQGINKNINKVWVRVFQSSEIWVGPDSDHLTEYKQRTTEPYGEPPGWQSAQLNVMPLTPTWQSDGSVLIQQSDPLPLDVVGLTIEVAIGG